MTADQIHSICFDCAKALGYTPKDKAVGVSIEGGVLKTHFTNQ